MIDVGKTHRQRGVRRLDFRWLGIELRGLSGVELVEVLTELLEAAVALWLGLASAEPVTRYLIEEPAPISIMAITAPTPMMIPRAVNMARIGLRRNALITLRTAR